MKKVILSLSIAVFMSLSTFAQNMEAQKVKQVDPKVRAEKVADKLTAELGLDKDQRNRVIALNQKKFADVKALDTKYNNDRKGHEAEYKKLRSDYRNNVSQLLTPEQLEKMKANKASHAGHDHSGHDHSGHAHPHKKQMIKKSTMSKQAAPAQVQPATKKVMSE